VLISGKALNRPSAPATVTPARPAAAAVVRTA
jgi:hypothetical protein